MMSSNLPTTDHEVNIQSLQIEIQRALATLSLKEADIIRMYFGLAPYPEE